MIRLALWGGFAVVLVLKLLFLDDKGTNDMDVALGWGHTLLERGLVDGYSGSNFPVAFQIYEGLVWLADLLGIRNEYAAMKGLNLLCDVGTFALLRVLLRRRGLNPDWAFAYWISPYFLVMWWLGFDHFQMGLIVIAIVVLVDAGRLGWASLLLGIGFVQRPQVQGLIAVLVLWGVLLAWRRDRESLHRVAILLVGPAVLWCAYALLFLIGGKDAFFLVRAYGEIAAFSPALSANMLNVWAVVAELYRDGPERLSEVHGPGVWHVVAALLGAGALIAGTWLIDRARRPLPETVLLLFALACVVLPNLYTRAHDVHFFLGAVLLVPVVAAIREGRGRLLAVLGAYLLLQALNSFGIYGFGQTPITNDEPFDSFLHVWDVDVRFVAAILSTGLFLTMMWLLRPAVTSRRMH